jgi:hypothetical protein
LHAGNSYKLTKFASVDMNTKSKFVFRRQPQLNAQDFLRNAMNNPKDRALILKFEQDFEALLDDDR